MIHLLVKGLERRQVIDPAPLIASGWTADSMAIRAAVSTAIDRACEDLARAWGYGTATQSPLSSATLYASVACAEQAECAALIAWKPALWAWLKAYQAAVAAGTQPAPTSPDQVLTLLWAAVPKPVR